MMPRKTKKNVLMMNESCEWKSFIDFETSLTFRILSMEPISFPFARITPNMSTLTGPDPPANSLKANRRKTTAIVSMKLYWKSSSRFSMFIHINPNIRPLTIPMANALKNVDTACSTPLAASAAPFPGEI